MQLQPWLNVNGKSQLGFSKETGLTQSQVWRLCNEGDVRGQAWAVVMGATRGEVTPIDHFSPKPKQTPKRKRRGRG